MRVVYAAEPEVLAHILTGGERRTSTVLSYLADMGVPVSFLASYDGASKGNVSSDILPRTLWYARQLAQAIDGLDCVVMIDYVRRFYVPIPLVLAGFRRDFKTAGLVHEFAFFHRQSRVKNLIDKWVSRLFFPMMDVVVAGSRQTAMMAGSLGARQEKLRVVPPALRPAFANYGTRSAPDDKRSRITLLMVTGQVIPRKGLEFLLEAMQLLDLQELELLVVGGTQRYASYAAEMINQARTYGLQEQVHFLGEIRSVDALIEMYEQADIFVLPSLYDTSPISIVEAMCVGLPVVASNVGGIPETVDEKTGLLVPAKDSVALAEAISSLIASPSMRAEMGKQGFEKAAVFRERTWDDVGAEYYDILSKLLSTG